MSLPTSSGRPWRVIGIEAVDGCFDDSKRSIFIEFLLEATEDLRSIFHNSSMPPPHLSMASWLQRK